MARPFARFSRSLVTLLALTALPGAASASPDTLRMALANLMEGPVDMVAAPVVAARTTVQNAGEVGLEPVGPVVYGALAHFGLTVLQLGWGTLRTASGALMLVPGVVLFPFPGVDLPQEADVFGRGDALVSWKNPLAEDPAWLEYVPPATPLTVDATLGITVPYSTYPDSRELGAVGTDEAAQ